MLGRRSVWSDDEVRALCSSFVLAADEVWRLQGGRDSAEWRARGGDDPECLAFQAIAHAGHYGPGPGSKQGIYVCTPSGEFLASINSNDPRRVAATLRVGLDAWRARSEPRHAEPTTHSEPRHPEPPTHSEPGHRFEWRCPTDGLVLFSTSRHLPDSGDPIGARGASYNHDHAWFTAAEARSLFAVEPVAGARAEVPRALFERLARFHFVDAVRGEVRPFAAGDVDGALHTTVVDARDGIVALRIEGETRGTARPRQRGQLGASHVAAQVLGRARYDLASRRFVDFTLLAVGTSTPVAGDPSRNRPARTLGVCLELADPSAPERRIAPTHIREYGAEWQR